MNFPRARLLRLSALAALLLRAAAAGAAPSLSTPEVEQCDGSFQGNATTRKPSPQIQIRMQDTGGLRVGQQRPSAISQTHALWTFDGNYERRDSGCAGTGVKTTTQTYVYLDSNGSEALQIGRCVYSNPAICTSTMTLSAATHPPLPLGGTCPATPQGAFGSTTTVAVPTAGQFGQSFSLDGSSTFAMVEAATAAVRLPQLPASYTFSAWIKTPGNGGRVQSLMFQDDGGGAWGFFVSASSGVGRVDSREDSGNTSASVSALSLGANGLNDDQWHYVAVTRRNGIDWRFFIDGLLISTTVAKSTVAFSSQFGTAISSHIDIGRNASVGWYFKGQIDEMRLVLNSVSDEFVFMEYDASAHKFSSDGGANVTRVSVPPASYVGGTPSNGTTAEVVYRPPIQSNITSQHQYTFMAQNASSGTTVTASLFGVTVDGSSPTAPSISAAPTGPLDMTWNWTVPTRLCGAPTYTPQYTLYNATSGAVVAVISNALSYSENFPFDAPNQKHARQVKVQDLWGTSPLSASVTSYTLAAAPSSLAAASVSTASLVLSWSGGSNPSYTRYEVALSSDNFASVLSTPAAVAQNHTATSLPITGLSPGTTYFFKVRSFNGRASDFSGDSYSSPATLNLVTLPAAPVLTGTVLSESSIRWDWTFVSGTAGFRLRAAGGSPLIVDTPLRTHTSAALSINTAYGAEVLAYNASGEGPASSASFVYTRSAVPSGPAVVSVSTVSVSYSWNANGNPGYTFYEVNVATDAAFGVVVATKTLSGTSLALGGLYPATSYYARVRSIDGSQTASAYVLFASTATNSDPSVALATSPPSAYAPPGGAVGIWHFDESSGASAPDSSGYSNAAGLTCLTAACASTPTFTTSGAPHLGEAVSFSGLPASLALAPHQSQYAFTGSISVGAWVNPATAALPDGAGIIAKGDGGAEAFALDAAGGRYRFIPKPGVVVTATSTVRAGQWDHVMGVFDAARSTASLYINGVLTASVSGVTAPRASNTHAVSIGSRQSGSGAYDLGFNGRIDEARLFNAAFDAAAVLAEYQGSFPGEVVLPAAAAGARLTLPPDAFGAPAQIYATSDPLNHPIRISFAALSDGLSNAPTGQLLVPGTLIEIVPLVGGVPFTATLGSPATLSLAYPDANGDGLVDGVSPPLHASGLRVHVLETSVGRWTPLSTTVDQASRRVSARTPHFSVFGLFGSSTVGATLSGVRVYPVPWKIGSGGRFDASGLVFDALPVAGTIRIFSLAGERVRELSFAAADAGRKVWDGRNGAGRPVASGVYFAAVKSSTGQTALVKIAIER